MKRKQERQQQVVGTPHAGTILYCTDGTAANKHCRRTTEKRTRTDERKKKHASCCSRNNRLLHQQQPFYYPPPPASLTIPHTHVPPTHPTHHPPHPASTQSLPGFPLQPIRSRLSPPSGHRLFLVCYVGYFRWPPCARLSLEKPFVFSPPPPPPSLLRRETRLYRLSFYIRQPQTFSEIKI